MTLRKSKNNLQIWPLLSALVMASVPVLAAPALEDTAALPHLDGQGQAGYRTFLQQENHRAFVIAPGGGRCDPNQRQPDNRATELDRDAYRRQQRC